MESINTTDQVKEYVLKCFDDSESPAEYPKYLESLRDFIRIPNLSPRFDPEWNTNGLLMQAWNHLKDFADSLDIIGYTSEIIKDDDKSPVLFMTVEPFNSQSSKTILWYAHLDKQPWGEGWDEGRMPNDPQLVNGKLYGRGSSDDGYGMYASLWAIKACQDLGLSHPRMYVFIEGSEESDIYDLTHYIDYFIKEKFKHDLDLVIALDSDTLSNELFTVTWSLRGIINFDIKVEALKDTIHSLHSGIYADTLTVANDLIRRLEDKDTYLMKDKYQIEIPKNRLDEIKYISSHGKFSKFIKSLEGIQTIPEAFIEDSNEHAYEEYLNHTWRSVLSIVGARGLPDCSIAGNWLRKSTTLTISIRTSPTINTNDMYNEIKEELSTKVPFNYKVSFDRIDLSNGWNSKLLSDNLTKNLEESVDEVYHWKPLFKGNGGAIPFVEVLGEKLPNAELLVTGASLPDDHAHGPNENLDMISLRNVTSTLAVLFTKY